MATMLAILNVVFSAIGILALVALLTLCVWWWGRILSGFYEGSKEADETLRRANEAYKRADEEYKRVCLTRYDNSPLRMDR